MSNKNLKLLLPLISGLLTGISFIIPYFGFICFFSIVPLFYSILYCNNNLAFSSVFIFSFAFSLTSDIWFMNIGNDLTDNKLYAFFISLSIILLVSFVLALFHSIPFSIYKYIVSSKKIKVNVILLSFLYIFGEWISGVFPPIAFPWNRLCNIVSGITPFIQSASVLGGLFISLSILCINGYLSVFLHFLIYKKFKKSILAILCSMSIFSVNILYGYVVMNNKFPEKENHSVLLVQGNYPKKEKWNHVPEEIVKAYIEIAESKMSDTPDIVIFPETALSANIFKDQSLLKVLTEFCVKQNTTIITGAQLKGEELIYNVCAVITSDGIHPDIYRKQILVPFGEYNPFGIFTFISSDFSAGKECVTINTDIGKIGSVICFESIFSDSVSECVEDGAEVITILSNDSWLGASIPLYQHHTHSIIRAVENRRYVLTSTNTGISSVVTPYGKILAETEKNTKSSVSAEFCMMENLSIYAFTGNIIIIPSCIIILYGSIKTFYRNKRK